MSLCSCAATALNECEIHGKNALARLLRAQDKEIAELREAQQRHLGLIRHMTEESVTPEEAQELRGQIASLIAEVGTLRQQQCSWATGKHDEECDMAAGLGKENAKLRGLLVWVKEEALMLTHHDPGWPTKIAARIDKELT